MKTFPTLYHKGSKGVIYQWRVWANEGIVYTEYGQKDGQKIVTPGKKSVAKNVGRSNETAPELQAELESEALWNNKRDRKYSETVSQAQEDLTLPMLAKEFNKQAKKVVYPVDEQPKLDGCRCTVRWEGSSVVLRSRSGKIWSTVPHINIQLALAGLPKDTVLDGELYVHGETCQTITSWIKKVRPESRKVQYWIYDMPEAEGVVGEPWSQRAVNLHGFMLQAQRRSCNSLKPVASIRCNDTQEVNNVHDFFVQQGFEGGIIRSLNGIYKYGYRSSDLLKLKQFDDNEWPIVGYREGVGKYAGCVVWICEQEGKKFEVNPRGTLEQKAEFYQNGDEYIGQQLKVRHFGMTDPDEDGIQLPRFPVGISIRLEEDMDASSETNTESTE